MRTVCGVWATTTTRPSRPGDLALRELRGQVPPAPPETEGIAPHPAVAYRILLDEQTEAKLKLLNDRAASTPRKKRKATSAGVVRKQREASAGVAK